jgi:hypothetical protein
MNATGNQLLAALGSGILPGAVSTTAPNASPDSLSFDEILRRMQSGSPSGVRVQLGKQIGIDQVNTEELQRVGHAADLASKSGFKNALVDLGGSIVRLDVKNRLLEAQLTPNSETIVNGIDGYISMRDTSDSADESPETGLITRSSESLIPARVVRNTSLADVLSARSE